MTFISRLGRLEEKLQPKIQEVHFLGGRIANGMSAMT